MSARHSPSRPVWIVGIVSAAIGGFVPIGDAAELTDIGILLAFIVVSAAVIVLRYHSPDLPRTFRTPLMPFTPLLGIAFSIWLISQLQSVTWLRFLAWFTLGMVIYALYGHRHSKLGHWGGRPDRQRLDLSAIGTSGLRGDPAPTSGCQPGIPARIDFISAISAD